MVTPHSPQPRSRRALLLVGSHALVGGLGFAAGIYLLPVLTAPKSAEASALRAVSDRARYRGRFVRELRGSDALHWAEADLWVAPDAVGIQGRIAPGPDYKLYLSPVFVEDAESFVRERPRMVRVGDVRNFEAVIVPLPAGIDPEAYTTAILWCETFSQFISAAQYRTGT